MRIVWTFCGTALLSLPLAAQTPTAPVVPTAKPDPKLTALIENLVHPRYAVREQAAKELEALGEAAIPALRAATDHNDEEMKERAMKLVTKIDNRLRSERLLAAPKLSVNFEDMKLEAAVTEMSRKTGLSFVLDKANIKNLDRTVTLKLEDVPYWEAVARFYKAAGLTENDNPPPAAKEKGDDQIRIQKLRRYVEPTMDPNMGKIRLCDGELPTQMVNDKAVRVWVMGKHPNNKYDDTKGECHFQIKVDAAPALSMQDIVGIDLRKAVDENKRNLSMASADGIGMSGAYEELMIAGRGGIQFQMYDGMVMPGVQRYQPLALKSDGIRPKQLNELAGVLVLDALTPQETLFTINDILNPDANRTASEGGTRCQITGTRKSGLNYTIINVRMETAAVEEMMNFNVQFKGRVRPFVRLNRGGDMGMSNGAPKVVIRDQTGKVVKQAITSTSIDSDGINLNYSFDIRIDQPNAKDKLSLSVEGRRSVTLEMPFNVKNVPLP